MNRSTVWRSVCLLLALLGCILGAWQAQRGWHKHLDQERWKKNNLQTLAHVPDALWQQAPPRGTPVCFEGHYAPQHFVWRNLRIENHAAMRVYSVLHLRDHQGVIVARGWQPDSKPEAIPSPSGLQTVCGHVSPPTRMPLIQHSLVTHGPATHNWHEVVSVIPEEWSQVTQHQLPNWVLHLHDDAPGALFVENFGGQNMTPGRHGAYALQWFALAVVAVFFACRKPTTTPRGS